MKILIVLVGLFVVGLSEQIATSTSSDFISGLSERISNSSKSEEISNRTNVKADLVRQLK